MPILAHIDDSLVSYAPGAPAFEQLVSDTLGNAADPSDGWDADFMAIVGLMYQTDAQIDGLATMIYDLGTAVDAFGALDTAATFADALAAVPSLTLFGESAQLKAVGDLTLPDLPPITPGGPPVPPPTVCVPQPAPPGPTPPPVSPLPCPTGTFYNPATGTCDPCPPNTAFVATQDGRNQCNPVTQPPPPSPPPPVSPLPCPPGTTYNPATNTCDPCPSGTAWASTPDGRNQCNPVTPPPPQPPPIIPPPFTQPPGGETGPAGPGTVGGVIVGNTETKAAATLAQLLASALHLPAAIVLAIPVFGEIVGAFLAFNALFGGSWDDEFNQYAAHMFWLAQHEPVVEMWMVTQQQIESLQKQIASGHLSHQGYLQYTAQINRLLTYQAALMREIQKGNLTTLPPQPPPVGRQGG